MPHSENEDRFSRVAIANKRLPDPSVKLAYDAPFPDPIYKARPLIMPQRVPNAVIITCAHDRDREFESIIINIRDGSIFTASRSNAFAGLVWPSVGACIKI